MPTGVGTDIIEIPRVKQAIDRQGQSFVDRLFTDTEQSYCKKFNDPFSHYAVRFAGKEAVLKALGTGIRENISWLDIEIVNNDLGKPIATLSGELKKRFPSTEIHISLSHSKTTAIAFAIAS